MKSKLKIEDLAVDSFVVSPADAGRGTVRGFDPAPGRTDGDWTCGMDQCPTMAATCTTEPAVIVSDGQPTCINTIEAYSCVVDICQPSHAYSCIKTDCGV
jgi:hypothetical protein